MEEKNERDELLQKCKTVDYDILDKILDDIGDFGSEQVKALVLICLCIVLYSATHVAYVFTAMDLNVR